MLYTHEFLEHSEPAVITHLHHWGLPDLGVSCVGNVINREHFNDRGVVFDQLVARRLLL